MAYYSCFVSFPQFKFNTLNPVWDQTFVLPDIMIAQNSLVVRFYDHDYIGDNDFLGDCEIVLRNVPGLAQGQRVEVTELVTEEGASVAGPGTATFSLLKTE